MMKAYEVMTHPLATCVPEASVTDVAAIMRDRNIGDVLIVEDGQLRGIVTDRDLTLQGLTGKDDPRQTPVRKYMSTTVVTGQPGWDLQQVANVMAKHQIRRLPIVQDEKLVGIISLGDVAQYEDQKHVVAKSLRAISEPQGTASFEHLGRGVAMTAMATLVMAVVATSVTAWLTWNHSGQAFRKQLVKSPLYHTAQHTLSTARDKVDEAASSKQMRNLRRDVGAKINDLSAQLPSVEYKPARRKHA